MSPARPGVLRCTPSVLTENPATAGVLDLIYGNSLIHLGLLAAAPFDRFGNEGSCAQHAARVHEVVTALALRSQLSFARRSALPTAHQLSGVDWGLVASLLRVSAEIRRFKAEAAVDFLEELIEDGRPI